MNAASDGIPSGVHRLSPSPFSAPASSARINVSARSQPGAPNTALAWLSTAADVRMLPCTEYTYGATLPCWSSANAIVEAPVNPTAAPLMSITAYCRTADSGSKSKRVMSAITAAASLPCASNITARSRACSLSEAWAATTPTPGTTP